MSTYFLHRLDGQILGPLQSEQLLQRCMDGRAFGDESISREGHGPSRVLESVPKLAEALAQGAAVRASRTMRTVSMVASELKRSVVQLRTPTGSGSGFAIDAHGTILTNRHVVEDSTTCTVHFTNGAISPGIVLFRSPRADVAIVRVAFPTADHVCLTERRGDDSAVGEQVVALGFPQDAGFNVTVGVISAVGVRVSPKESEEHSRHEWVRTSAEINGGNSGGPLVDLHGSVVGMATWGQIFDGGGRPVSGMNYCIPHPVICRELREFRRRIADGEITVPSPEDIVRSSHQPDAFEELELAVNLICDRFAMRVVKKVPIPGMQRGFHHACVASSKGDVLDMHVDSFVFKDGPLYLTMYCRLGELPEAALQNPKSLGSLLQMNQRLPHWNLALRDSHLMLRYSRELELLDAAEIVNAIEDLEVILKNVASSE